MHFVQRAGTRGGQKKKEVSVNEKREFYFPFSIWDSKHIYQSCEPISIFHGPMPVIPKDTRCVITTYSITLALKEEKGFSNIDQIFGCHLVRQLRSLLSVWTMRHWSSVCSFSSKMLNSSGCTSLLFSFSQQQDASCASLISQKASSSSKTDLQVSMGQWKCLVL